MRLSAFRKNKGLSISEAAAELNVSSVGYRYWERGLKIPSRECMAKIHTWSGGAVMPNDFYELPSVASNTDGDASRSAVDTDRSLSKEVSGGDPSAAGHGGRLLAPPSRQFYPAGASS